MALQREADSLVDEFNRIVASTQFNDQALFGSASGRILVQCGVGANGGISFSTSSELSHAAGTGSFQVAQSITLQGGSGGVTPILGDVDGDKILDLVIADYFGDWGRVVSVFHGNGDGSFAAQKSFSGWSQQFCDIALSDIDRDGDLDIVVASASPGYGIYQANGDGSFLAPSYIDSPIYPNSIAVRDINGDGKDDIVGMGSTLGVSLGNGDGTFRAERTFNVSGLGWQWQIRLNDLNEDGNLDVIAPRCVFMGNGDGTFKAGNKLDIGSSAYGVDVADINRDGRLDLVTADVTGGKLYTFVGNGDGSFKARITTASGSFPQEVALTDLNNDGLLDFVSAEVGTDQMIVRFGNGDGSFKAGVGTSTNLPSWGNPTFGFVVDDLNGDGVKDVLVGGQASSSSAVLVLLGSTERVSAMPYLDLLTQSSARQTLAILDETRTRVSQQMGALGASLSRFDTALATSALQSENLMAAGSRIMDADIAMEAATLTRAQVLQSAGAAILAQANQGPSIALTLLR